MPGQLTRRLLEAVLCSCILALGTHCDPLNAKHAVWENVIQNKTSVFQDIMRLSKAFAMLNYMDRTAEPCENFYEFACGKWRRINPADSLERPVTGQFLVISEALERKVAQALRRTSGSAENTESDEKLKTFFRSCLQLKTIEASYQGKLLEIIEEFGEMPALKGAQWQADKFDWLQTVAKIRHKYGINIVLGLYITKDWQNDSVNRIYFGHPHLPLKSRTAYLNDSATTHKVKYLSDMIKNMQTFLGLDENLAERVAVEILHFETALAAGLADESLGLGMDELTQLITIEELHTKYAPTLDIKKYLSMALGADLAEPIYEFVPQYQLNLIQLIRATPKSVVANYVYYGLLRNFMFIPAESHCIKATKAHFARSINDMIYRKYYTPEAATDLEFIWRALKDSLKTLLLAEELIWIPTSTLASAFEQLDDLQFQISADANDGFIEELHKVNISAHDFLENLRNMLQFASVQALAKLHRSPESDEVRSYMPIYSSDENVVRVPVMLLQPYTLWAAGYPNSIKYSALGSLLARALIHAVGHWCNMVTREEFYQKTECLTKQYAKYRYGGRYLRESTAQAENVADNAGVRLAFAAYAKWGARRESEPLPKMNYTREQLFFISYAQLWCNDVHPRVKQLTTATDRHVPGEFRVIGPLSNFEDFSKAFKCDVGASMNPNKKCRVY